MFLLKIVFPSIPIKFIIWSMTCNIRQRVPQRREFGINQRVNVTAILLGPFMNCFRHVIDILFAENLELGNQPFNVTVPLICLGMILCSLVLPMGII